MTNQSPKAVETQNNSVTDVSTKLPQEGQQNAINDQLVALYRFSRPTLEGTDLLAIVADRTGLHAMRQAIQPFLYAGLPIPFIAVPGSISRHLLLKPILADHINQTGQLLTGQAIDLNPTAVSIPEQIAYLAHSAFESSIVIAPGLLMKSEVEPGFQQLANLTHFLEFDSNQERNSPVKTIAAIQAHLSEQISRHPELSWEIPPPTGAPPLIDSLMAIYENQDHIIMMLPDWPADEIGDYINGIDWTAVTASLDGQYKGLQITTPSQFRLILQYARSADYYFNNFHHAWGINALASLDIPMKQIYRDLAVFASQLEIETMARAYVAVEDDQLHQLIHDYSNKLQNIQLREELLHRMIDQPRAIPPISLPDGKSPATEKVTAIFNQFAWWADHYTEKMNKELS